MYNCELHLIPNIMADNSSHVIPHYLKEIVTSIKIFYVEEIKSARRFLKMMNREIIIDELTFYMLNEHESESLQLAKQLFNTNSKIGLISEAGCPNIADPGQELVALAHQHNVKVIPHVGPNSILLALMASGFNGQQFQFLGYLPNKQPMLTQRIKEIELESAQKNCSQIFIETPYRNDQLLKELLNSCRHETRICVAANLTGENEVIISKSVAAWKTEITSFHKMPAVFVLYTA
jgi:16S rRNA (cytidine1402-2'-O)-methyltransferase